MYESRFFGRERLFCQERARFSAWPGPVKKPQNLEESGSERSDGFPLGAGASHRIQRRGLLRQTSTASQKNHS
jgi:hypothetical protein